MMRSDHRITHPLNVSYLVVGLIFLGISGSWALRSTGLVDARHFDWVLPLMLVVVGAVGLFASTASGMRRRRAGDDDPADTGSPDVSDPIPTYSFGIDDLEEKLERAARSGSTSSLAEPSENTRPERPVDLEKPRERE